MYNCKWYICTKYTWEWYIFIKFYITACLDFWQRITSLILWRNSKWSDSWAISKSQIFHSDFTEKRSETQRPLSWEIGTKNPKTIEFKLRIYEINIVKKRDDDFVKHRFIDRSILCCFHLEIKKILNDLTVKSCVGAFKRFTRDRTLHFISQWNQIGIFQSTKLCSAFAEEYESIGGQTGDFVDKTWKHELGERRWTLLFKLLKSRLMVLQYKRETLILPDTWFRPFLCPRPERSARGI